MLDKLSVSKSANRKRPPTPSIESVTADACPTDDTVLYDFEDGQTFCKSKALTTKWDFTLGIRQALDRPTAAAAVPSGGAAVS